MNITPIVQVKSANLYIGNKPIFVNLELSIYPKDKICLIGRNGCGKSSLMKVLTGEYELDNGSIMYKKNTEVGYLTQALPIARDETIYNFLLADITLREGEAIEQKRYLADIMLDKLQLSGNDNMLNLSGGQLRRSSLAKALLLEPDLLLLDEPTNHLDISSIEWLETYINNYPGSILCVSHDRRFLVNTTNKIMWLDRTKLHYHDRGFAHFTTWAEQLLLQEENELKKLKQKLAEENSWLQTGVTARRKRNQGRLANLHSLRAKLRQDRETLNMVSGRISLPAITPSAASKLIIEMEDVSYTYPSGPKVLDNFSLRINRGEKIGIIGPNGCGKSSFIKLITGVLKPQSGTIRLGSNAEVAYFDQNRESLNPNKTLWQTIAPNEGSMVAVGNTTKHVVAYLKDFLFQPDQAHMAVSSLSGGEANRLLLAKVLLKPGTLLILDEPTNDLDMDSLDILLELLSDYKGTLLIVSHDRDFLDQLVTRSLIFTPTGIIDHIGGYQEYQQHQSTPKANKKKAVAHTPIAKPGKMTYKLQYELANLPDEIDKLSHEIELLEAELTKAELAAQPYTLLQEMAEKLTKLKSFKVEKEDRWLELAMLKDSLQ